MFSTLFTGYMLIGLIYILFYKKELSYMIDNTSKLVEMDKFDMLRTIEADGISVKSFTSMCSLSILFIPQIILCRWLGVV